MEIIEVTASEFKKIIPKPYFVFGSADFAELNRDKAETVFYLLFKDSKYRLGITGGILNGTFNSPFSAPYGGFVYLSKDVRISMLDEALDSLITWAKENHFKALNFTTPPLLFNESFVSKQINSFFRRGFKINNIDLNYSFNLNEFNDTYKLNIWHNARKNLNAAIKNNLIIKLCIDEFERSIAYDIVRKNRELRGFPLNMTFEQISRTIKLIPGDFFIIQNKTGQSIGSAIVFYVSEKIVRVIYWADLPEFSHLRTMNFIAFKIFEYYKNLGTEIIDVGISTVKSLPNNGLCDFKESIGCEAGLQYSFTLEI